MKLLLLCICLVPTAMSTSFGQTSVVITSKDVKDGLTASKLPLKAGDKHRVYAVFASSATTDAYARGVIIRGADNKQFNVADLAKAKAGTPFVLDENKILTAPITIADTNSGAGRVPYTIYIVSTNILMVDNSTLSVAPVFSAQLAANGAVDCKMAQLSSASCTILSAEKSIQLSSFAMGDMDSIDVQVAGFDVSTPTRYTDYTVMSVSRAASGDSFVNIPGPIATLHNPAGTPTNHGFVVKRDMAWSGLLSPGASTTFLSNGFHDVGESYATDYDNVDVLSRDYDFGVDTPISFVGSIGNYYPDSGDYLSFVCIKDKGSASFYVYDVGDLAGQVQSDVCKKVSIFATIGSRTTTGPRFMVQMESGGTNWKA